VPVPHGGFPWSRDHEWELSLPGYSRVSRLPYPPPLPSPFSLRDDPCSTCL